MNPSIRVIGPGEAKVVLDAGALFDHAPQPSWTEQFLADRGHHLLMAFVGEEPVGFVSGIVTRHPDKGPEMLLYELGVAEGHRRRGIGSALVGALRDHARASGHRGMWVVIDEGDEIPAATYRAAGATGREVSEVMTWSFDQPD